MIFVSFIRVIRFGFQNFFRNCWLAVATVSVLMLTLVSVNVLVVMNVLGKAALSTVESRIDVSVHFKPDVEDSRIQTVKIALLSMPEVEDVEYVSPAQVLEQFSETYKKDTLILKSLGEVGSNPFGATLAVKAHSLEGYDAVLASLDDPSFGSLIEDKDFDDRQMMIGKVQGISKKVEFTVFGLSVLFGLITLLIVFNTIRMSIYTHREEIGIMRLVGASDWFIRAPFYVEAIIWSILSVGVVMAVVYPSLVIAQPFVSGFFGSDLVDLRGFYTVNVVNVFGLQLVGIALMALVTTKLATSRYLKV